MPKIDPQTGEVVPDVAIGSNQQIDPNTGEVITPPAQEPTLLQKAMTGAKDLGVGALKGAGSTATNIGSLVYPHWLERALTGKDSSEKEAQLFAPSNTAQSIGKVIEQAGEFLVPGGAEEAGAEKLASLAPKLGKVAKPLARVLTSGASSGLVNKAQGGDFTTGAALGAGGAGVGQGLKVAAPAVAETALGIPKVARAFGRTPGKAILEETRGIRPETVGRTAQEALDTLNPELEAKVAASPNQVSLQPARDFLDQKMAQAQAQNAEGLHGQYNRMANTLQENFGTKQRIPQVLPASDALNLKRGFGEEHTSWNPEVRNKALSAGRYTYGLLDKAIDDAVPESAELNQRISSLVPVAKRAESVSRNAPTIQRALSRFGAHTGALTLGAMGGAEGYREGGIPGAIAGGVTGVVAPELIASPEGQMLLARQLNNARGLKPVVGALAQFKGQKKDTGSTGQ